MSFLTTPLLLSYRLWLVWEEYLESGVSQLIHKVGSAILKFLAVLNYFLKHKFESILAIPVRQIFCSAKEFHLTFIAYSIQYTDSDHACESRLDDPHHPFPPAL